MFRFYSLTMVPNTKITDETQENGASLISHLATITGAMIGDLRYNSGVQITKLSKLNLNRPNVVSRIKSMQKIVGGVYYGVFALLLIVALNGCQTYSTKDGIHVMFNGVPKIYHDQVYFHGQVVGKIVDKQVQNGPVAKVNIQIDSNFREDSGRHWAFYVANGRLTVGRLNSSGRPLTAGDRVCGFHSKSDFTWFKVRTLLGPRISKANRRADKLYERFAQAG